MVNNKNYFPFLFSKKKIILLHLFTSMESCHIKIQKQTNKQAMKLPLELEAGEQLYQIKFEEWVESNRHVYLQLGGSLIETGYWEENGLTLSFFSKKIIVRRPKYDMLGLEKPSDIPWPKHTLVFPKPEENISILNLHKADDECVVTHNNGEKNSLLMERNEHVYVTRLHFGS
jgi:hypothetical protein